MAKRNGKAQDFQSKRDSWVTFQLEGGKKKSETFWVCSSAEQYFLFFFNLKKAIGDRSASLWTAAITASSCDISAVYTPLLTLWALLATLRSEEGPSIYLLVERSELVQTSHTV